MVNKLWTQIYLRNVRYPTIKNTITTQQYNNDFDDNTEREGEGNEELFCDRILDLVVVEVIEEEKEEEEKEESDTVKRKEKNSKEKRDLEAGKREMIKTKSKMINRPNVMSPDSLERVESRAKRMAKERREESKQC